MKPTNKIPRSVIEELNRDLAKLTAEFAAKPRKKKKQAAATFAWEGPLVMPYQVGKRGGGGKGFAGVGKAINAQVPWSAPDMGEPSKLVGAFSGAAPMTIVGTPEEIAPESTGLWDRLRDKLTAKAIALRNKYRNNPYILIKGFSIELGVSPSLSIDFEFKD
jgi:hypothetical protein